MKNLFKLLGAVLGAIGIRFFVSWLWFAGLFIGGCVGVLIACLVFRRPILKRSARGVSRSRPTSYEFMSFVSFMAVAVSLATWYLLGILVLYRGLSLADLWSGGKFIVNVIPMGLVGVYNDQDGETAMRKLTSDVFDVALIILPPVIVFVLLRKAWRVLCFRWSASARRADN